MKLAAICACLVLSALPGRAADWKSLKPQGYVSDFAGVIDPRSKAAIESYAARVEQATGAQLAFVTIQERASVEAQRISTLQYREGTIDVTSLLVSQQSQFNAQDTLIQAKLSRLNASLALYIALGGGWNQKQSDADYKPQLDWFPL